MTDSPAVGPDARGVLDAGRALLASGEAVADAVATARAEVVAQHRGMTLPAVADRLEAIPVERLRAASPGLRLAGLAEAGFATVGDVLRASPEALDALDGVGPASAQATYQAAQEVARAVTASMQVRLDADRAEHTPLVAALVTLADVLAAARPLRQLLDKVVPALRHDLPLAEPARSRLRWWFTPAARRAAASTAVDRVAQTTRWASENRVSDYVDRVRAAARPAASEASWRRFEASSAELYGVLAETVGLRVDTAAVEGFLPSEIVAAIQALKLDATHTTMTLRAYQSFGARFALVQRRTILGDDMGLGKTVQALAAIAHLAASGQRHALVVCPASVIVNWVREVAARTTLTAHRLHGDDRDPALTAWLTDGGVAVTTFETLASLALPPDQRLAMLVVDEAHYVKNPRTRRAAAVGALGQRADRVLYLTGTPLENSVAEFRSLVATLAPAVALDVDDLDAVAGPDAFRAAVAPVYLRRNADDVLTELPDLLQSEEWVEFTTSDAARYADAVAAGNFSAMRRAAFGAQAQGSAKLARLLELCNEARKNGRRVVVFSYFLGVLAGVHGALVEHGFTAHGPLTGATPASDRQAMVDAFAAGGPAVLVCQIQAGGVGLNMQAASVVVLCEPQVKPTLEAQAIARAHRMGQTRTVSVHRLLVADSVDERLLEILDHKAALFDAFARDSTLAEASPTATDASEVALGRRVVAAEQARLAGRQP